jgi:hypothetical protein
LIFLKLLSLNKMFRIKTNIKKTFSCVFTLSIFSNKVVYYTSKNIVSLGWHHFPKIKKLKDLGYNIFIKSINSESIEVVCIKPHFLSISDKISSPFFYWHYSNSKWLFIGWFCFLFLINFKWLIITFNIYKNIHLVF